MISFLAAALITGNSVRTLYSPIMRIDSTATNYVAAVSWEPGARSSFVIDLIEVSGGGRKLLTSTRIDDAVDVFRVGTSCLPGPRVSSGKVYARGADQSFLTTSVNGGQFDHLLVWQFDPSTLRPKRLLDALMGDASQLDLGLVVENSIAKYVSPGAWPKGISDDTRSLQRTWSYDREKAEFKPGSWRAKAD